jgi:hypothetical protein
LLGYLDALQTMPVGARVPGVDLLHGTRNGTLHPVAALAKIFRQQAPALDVTIAYSRPEAGDRLGEDFDMAGHLDPALL